MLFVRRFALAITLLAMLYPALANGQERNENRPRQGIFSGSPLFWRTDWVLEAYIGQITRYYNLNKEQEEYTRKLLNQKVKSFLQENERDVRGLVESGDLRVLATTAPARPSTGIGRNIPTAREQGIDAEFLNWRGIFGPPEMPDYAVTFWRDALAKMVKTPEWIRASDANGWVQNYADAPEFVRFLEAQTKASRDILVELGMIK